MMKTRIMQSRTQTSNRNTPTSCFPPFPSGYSSIRAPGSIPCKLCIAIVLKVCLKSCKQQSIYLTHLSWIMCTCLRKYSQKSITLSYQHLSIVEISDLPHQLYLLYAGISKSGGIVSNNKGHLYPHNTCRLSCKTVSSLRNKNIPPGHSPVHCHSIAYHCHNTHRHNS